MDRGMPEHGRSTNRLTAEMFPMSKADEALAHPEAGKTCCRMLPEVNASS